MLLDIGTFLYLYSFAGISLFFDWLIIFFSSLLPSLMVIVAALFIIVRHVLQALHWRRKTKNKFARKFIRMLVFAKVSLLTSIIFLPAFIARFGITELIRVFVNRTRPFEVFGFEPLIQHTSGYSFPSGHAAFLFALATMLYFWNKNLGIIFFVLSLLVGLARIIAGVHFPSDILFGGLIGIATALTLSLISAKRRQRS